MRIGVSARLARTALAQAFDTDLDRIEELWHVLRPPYTELFAWLDGTGPEPRADHLPVLPPLHARPPAGGRAGRPGRLCGGVEVGRHPGAAGPCRWRNPALQPHGRRHHGELSRRGRRLHAPRRARRRADGARHGAGRRGGRGGLLQRAAAAAGAQDGNQGDAGRGPRLCAAVRRAGRRHRGFARPALDGAARPAGSADGRLARRPVRPVGGDRGGGLRRPWA